MIFHLLHDATNFLAFLTFVTRCRKSTFHRPGVSSIIYLHHLFIFHHLSLPSFVALSLPEKCPYFSGLYFPAFGHSVRMRESTDQKNSR